MMTNPYETNTELKNSDSDGKLDTPPQQQSDSGDSTKTVGSTDSRVAVVDLQTPKDTRLTDDKMVKKRLRFIQNSWEKEKSFNSLINTNRKKRKYKDERSETYSDSIYSAVRTPSDETSLKVPRSVSEQVVFPIYPELKKANKKLIAAGFLFLLGLGLVVFTCLFIFRPEMLASFLHIPKIASISKSPLTSFFFGAVTAVSYLAAFFCLHLYKRAFKKAIDIEKLKLYKYHCKPESHREFFQSHQFVVCDPKESLIYTDYSNMYEPPSEDLKFLEKNLFTMGGK